VDGVVTFSIRFQIVTAQFPKSASQRVSTSGGVPNHAARCRPTVASKKPLTPRRSHYLKRGHREAGPSLPHSSRPPPGVPRWKRQSDDPHDVTIRGTRAAVKQKFTLKSQRAFALVKSADFGRRFLFAPKEIQGASTFTRKVERPAARTKLGGQAAVFRLRSQTCRKRPQREGLACAPRGMCATTTTQ